MHKYYLLIISLLISINVFSQSDNTVNTETIFLQKKETLIEQIKEFEGKVIYLDTWATYCSPCIKWLKKKKDYEQFFKDNNIVVLCICFDKADRKDKWKSLINQYSITGNHLFIDNDMIDSYLLGFKAKRQKSIGRGFPRFLIIDKKGNVVESSAYAPTKMLVNQMQKYLGN